MTKEIKGMISHILLRAARTILRETPILSSIVDGINMWLQSIDYAHLRKMSKDERKSFESSKIKELQTEIKKRSNKQ